MTKRKEKIEFFNNKNLCVVDDRHYYKITDEGNDCDNCDNIACSNNGGSCMSRKELGCYSKLYKKDRGVWKSMTQEEFFTLTFVTEYKSKTEEDIRSDIDKEICSMIL